LFNQLSQLHSDYVKTLKRSNEKNFSVYRGQQLSIAELKKLQDNIGGLISVMTFLSTTTSSSTAVDFAGDGYGRPYFESIFMEIEINLNVVTTPFANISKLSHLETENEVLFSVGTIFRIDCVERHTSTLWYVKLTLCEEDNKEVKCLIDHFKSGIGQFRTTEHSFAIFGSILCEMGEYEKAKQYYFILLRELEENHPLIVSIYESLACVCAAQADKWCVSTREKYIPLVTTGELITKTFRVIFFARDHR
ncbi:unnamed protein product, partial [Didymodactylos carnosus]